MSKKQIDIFILISGTFLIVCAGLIFILLIFDKYEMIKNYFNKPKIESKGTTNTILYNTILCKPVKNNNSNKNQNNIPAQEVKYEEIETFFDPLTGKILVYYYKDEFGYHFFRRSGFDPVTGAKLLPVNKKIIRNYKKRLAQEKSALEKKYDEKLKSELNNIKQKYQSEIDKTNQKLQEETAKSEKLTKTIHQIAQLDLLMEFTNQTFRSTHCNKKDWYLVYNDNSEDIALGLIYVYDIQNIPKDDKGYIYRVSCLLLKGKMPNDNFYVDRIGL